MKTIETLFTQETKFDSKSILNKFNKPIDKSILDRVEAGITLEDIEELTKQNIPVLKYKTQITIHGLFPELNNSYIFGYKNLFQNKNKSIGVKYNAIDEEKRKRIAERLNCIGFNYSRNSLGTQFNIINRVTPETFESIKSTYLDIKSKIDQRLYFGHFNIWVGSMYGMKYLCFDLYINAIYEHNIEPFLNKLGATAELLQIAKDKKEAKEVEYKKKYEEERKEAEAKRQASNESKSDQIKLLQTYPRKEKTNEPGMYILRTFDYDNNLVFKVIYLYLPKGKQKPRWNKMEYITIHEALNHECIEKYSDSIYSSKLTGYKIK